MIYPSADKLENWGSKYSLVVLAAKRAKQIKSGAPPLIDTTSRNPLTIALEEIAAGKIQCKVADHDILPKTAHEAEVAQLLAIPTLSLDEEEATEETAVLSDDTELVTEDEEELEEEEHAVIEEDELPISGFEEEADEKEHVDVDDEVDEEMDLDVEDDDDAEVDHAAAEEAELLAPPEPPKPKRGRKKKVEAEPEAVASEDSDD